LDHFTSADEWAQLHFFSLVAFATYKRAIEYVSTTPYPSNLIQLGKTRQLMQVSPPLVMLLKQQGRRFGYELRIFSGDQHGWGHHGTLRLWKNWAAIIEGERAMDWGRLAVTI
jgi:hypothetical protein